MKVRVASAGTGKTTSLVLRYLELIGQGTPLRRIAGVTFTRAAAGELRQRVGEGIRQILNEGAYLSFSPPHDEGLFEEAERELAGATLSTIHGFMIETLRLVAPRLGLDPNFSVLGEWEAQALFEEELMSTLYLAQDPDHPLKAALPEVGEGLSNLALYLFAQRSLSEAYTASDSGNSAVLRIYEAAYRRYLLRLGAKLSSPSEVERRALKLVGMSAALGRVAERYRVVLVDEFQDVNPLQGMFFEKLEAQGIAVEVVGDPKQSIYGFRNADVGVFRRALANGDLLPPLDRTRRHSRVITRFLNHLTDEFARRSLGFGPQEAPEVRSAGSQAEVTGSVELHWVEGNAPIGDLRKYEARVLAERLESLNRHTAYKDMAVLARSYAGLELAHRALTERGIPAVLLQGRGYFERLEVRDLYHALRVGIEPEGLSLAAWLRSPFAALSMPQLDALLRDDRPLAVLEREHPEVYARLEGIREQVRAGPLAALKYLIREPFIDGQRYVDFLDTRARENVDALLFTVAAGPPGDLEMLLERLDRLSLQRDAGDVPQSGEGVSLLTVHGAKGLEWPLVAVYDLGRMNYSPPQPLYIDPDNGRIAAQDGAETERLKDKLKTRSEEESYRLFYVAASRARDTLVLTGSVKNDRPTGWAAALDTIGLGPKSQPFDRSDFVLKTRAYKPGSQGTPSAPEAPGPEAAPWLERRFTAHPLPPVFSPSRLKDRDDEPLPPSNPEEGEVLPGRARTVGTLVHYAISQNWSAAEPRHLENLKAQEVMFPFDEAEQADIIREVAVLLGTYEGLLGEELPPLADRDEDHPELPMALPQGTTVWQGVIDRLYRVGERWYLEDYKTDKHIAPEKYYFQLAVYLEAIREVKGVAPEVRLVYLREGKVLAVDPGRLEGQLESLPT